MSDTLSDKIMPVGNIAKVIDVKDVREAVKKFDNRINDSHTFTRSELLLIIKEIFGEGLIYSQEGEARTKASEFHAVADISGQTRHSVSPCSPTPDTNIQNSQDNQ